MKFFRNQIDNKKDKSEKEELPGASASASENYQNLMECLYHTGDLKSQNLVINQLKFMLIYLETMADPEKIQKFILPALHKCKSLAELDECISSAGSVKTQSTSEAADLLLEGYCLITVDTYGEFWLLQVRASIQRPPLEPENEKVVRGSHIGFVEDMAVNLRMIRQRMANKKLVFRYLTKGKETNTKIVLAYVKGIADEKIAEAIYRKTEKIGADMIFSPGYMQEFMEEHPYSPFPQFLQTERPDRVMANLMEGRVAILAEGSPTTIVLPVTFFSFFQSPDDYNSRFLPGAFYRILRFISFIIALILPSVYIAVIAFHFEVVPSDLVIPLKTSVSGIPFPPLLEAFIMVFTIELIREAGIRLPTPIGQTIGIVGGLIIGDAVVRAGLISNMMIIVIALTTVSSFSIPSVEMSASLRLLTFPLMILSSVFGFLGIMFGLMIIMIHLCKLQTFQSPYLEPIAPFTKTQYKDTFLRFPIRKQQKTSTGKGNKANK
ncbi:spore germination protein [Actinomycetes bacterium NPDC127524]